MSSRRRRTGKIPFSVRDAGTRVEAGGRSLTRVLLPSAALPAMGLLLLAAPLADARAGSPRVPLDQDQALLVASSAPQAFPSGLSAVHFPEGAPPRVTGGFGEDSCLACHWNGAENEGGGTLRLTGFPARFEEGERYLLALELEHPGMEVAGFQLAVRTLSDTTQAGELAVPEGEEGRVTVAADRGVQFAQHLEGGIPVGKGGRSRWSVEWVAPGGGDRVAIHGAAVAGDGDRSQLGDHVYTVKQVARPRSP